LTTPDNTANEENPPTATPEEVVALRNEFVQNPHELYRTLRARGPIHRAIMRGKQPIWLVTDFDLARELLLDPRLSKDNTRALQLFRTGGAGSNATKLGANLLHLDPPDHTRLRGLVSRAFTARAIARLRPSIEARVDELLDELPTGEPIDLVRAFAMPLPGSVISMLLGMPAEDGPRLAEWTTYFVSNATSEELAVAEKAVMENLATLIVAKRANPGEDILSGLIQARDAKDMLDQRELVTTVFLLILAGFETTVNLIANGVHALLRAPQQLALLRARPDLLPNAVEELLRLESPLNTATDRFTTEPITVAGVEIPAGEFIKIALLGANHAETQFPDPDRLDIERVNAGSHLAFGHGIHYCLGAPLARLEGEVAFGRLLARFPFITLVPDAELVYRPSVLVHGLMELPVRLDTSVPPTNTAARSRP
jgi:cytochrome P450